MSICARWAACYPCLAIDPSSNYYILLISFLFLSLPITSHPFSTPATPSMLSKRERRPVDDISSPQQNSQIAYRRTSIPSLHSVSSSNSTLFPSSLFSRRAPLAPLHPQISTLQPLDNQMPPSSSPKTPTIVSYPSQDNPLDSKRLPDPPKHGLGKYITTNRSLDDDPLPPPRRSIGLYVLSSFAQVCSINPFTVPLLPLPALSLILHLVHSSVVQATHPQLPFPPLVALHYLANPDNTPIPLPVPPP